MARNPSIGGRKIWTVTWERDGGDALVYVSSSRAGAFDWVRNNFQPEREAPSSKNVIVIRPLYIDRQLSGRVAFTAAQDRKGELVFRDSQTSLPVER